MRYVILFLSGILLMTVACKDSAPKLCDALQNDLLNFNVPDIKDQLDEWLIGLHPNPTKEDPTGHLNNLVDFINRLNEECDLEASLGCYACIKTFPAQTEIIIQVNGPGGNVQRSIDISTPESDIMTIVNVHE
ncbi:MAG TPA: hypothetical protein VFG10_15475 [Saprospiraceae bacterium]|nr:hypothetical protein [Saprospiraceae bacterium]